MRFRPCIDLRAGRVVQIVGGTIADGDESRAITNFETDRAPADFAALYRADNLPGGHVIALGPGNREAALAALGAFPGGMHMGGGITPQNAGEYLDAGASHVIVTSYIFQDGQLHWERLAELVAAVGRERLVLDLSCRARDGAYWVVTDRWQSFTQLRVDAATLEMLARHCAEFLVHGVDVEGMQLGIEEELVAMLGRFSPLPVTYAGGARSMLDLDNVYAIGNERVDLTIGSALDIFGGDVPYLDVVAWQRRMEG